MSIEARAQDDAVPSEKQMTGESFAREATSVLDVAAASREAGLLRTLRWSWQYRHLMRNLVARDLKVRYRGSVLGFAWTFLNPLLMTLVFSYVLTYVLRAPDIGVPFPAFFLVGMLAWNFCVISIMGSMVSIVGNASLVSKVYFPRSILPIAVVIAAAVNYVLAQAVSLPVIWALGVKPSWSLLAVPVVLLEQVIFLIGLALILSVLNVIYRDTAPTVEVLVQAWFFLTPIIYPLSTISQGGRFDTASVLLLVNPMAAIVTMYHSSLLFGELPEPALAIRTLIITGLVCLLGIVVFARNSDRIGDEL
jgi:ABC-type polysaccharide/polyol phosphate export permease